MRLDGDGGYGGMLKAGARSNPEEELVRVVDVVLGVDAIIILEIGEMAVTYAIQH